MPSAESLPHVAVLLLNWNGREDTLECLESVFRLSYPRMSVILCDNASTDGSVEAVREWARGVSVPALPTPQPLRHLVEPRVPKPIAFIELSRVEAESSPPPVADRQLVVIHNGGNLGFAAGNNVGLRYAALQPSLSHVWILNNDIVVDPESLRALVRRARETPRVGGVGGVLYEYDSVAEIQSSAGGLFPPWKGVSIPVKRVRYDEKEGKPVPRLDYLSAGCMLVPVELIRTVGLIDESYFMYGEDVDYSFRMRRAGYELAFAPDAKVWHKGGRAMGVRSARHDYYIVRNSLHIVKKYYPRMLPIATLYVAYRCILPKVVRRQWDRLRVLKQAYEDFRNGAFGPVVALPGDAVKRNR